ncbi:MAG TPA: hypothetical protein VFC81_00015 [Verrucomicrobiae bacterium]|nr:hypothetical protein [Verrucomicrobiae bacterium]
MITNRLLRTTRVRRAAIAVAALALVLPAAAPAQAAGLRNCADVTGPAACYEIVWANGVQHRMTFSNQHFSGAPASGNLDPFYVLAPQTATPQGTFPFLHDHVVGDVPSQNHGDYSVQLHAFFVFCSAQGLATGGCVPTLTPIPGFGTVPFAKTVNGQMLTTVQPIESAANAGLVTLFDTGGVIVGTISGN